MKIFALQTDEEKLIQSFLSSDEKVVLRVKFSAFMFVLRSIKAFVFTVIIIALGGVFGYSGLPALVHVPVLAFFWFFFVFVKWVMSFLDWKYDLLLVTTDEIVVVDQGSLFRVSIRQMNLDNIASVASKSQYMNLFPFGTLMFDLKEGTGNAVVLHYIPKADRVASIISDSLVRYQRRRSVMAQALAHGADPATAKEQARKAEGVQ